MSNAHRLSEELRTFEEKLPELMGQAGKFALVKDSEVEGAYDTYEDAVKVGYERFKLEPFLVKQIAPAQRIFSFTRDLKLAGDNT